jgi:hypothetical protein
MIGATVEFQLPIDLGLAQLLDREIQLLQSGLMTDQLSSLHT